MTPASLPLQKAVYERLLADLASFEELGGPPRIFDAPPAGAPFPYVVIGEASVSKLPGHDAAAHDFRIEIFSRHAGRREVKLILDRVVEALHDADFPVDGARLVNCRFVFGDIFRPDGGETFRGLLRFRCVTESLT
ncbi:MAG: DUF3168 domain-containing protein [Parvularculaceae bacterium]|nr:DUF3168 domain-containing protein [Parvularculaceae bacterium]